jgi:hypothetical protein
MTSETELSTADLAQPAGARQQDRADAGDGSDRRPEGTGPEGAERSYETSGNRVAQGPADQDTVELPQGAPGAGSTRNDALPAGADRDKGSRDMADRDMTDRDRADRDMGGRDMADRDMADRRMGGGDMGGRGMDDRDMGGRDMADPGMDDRDMGGRDMAGRDAGGGPDRGMAGRDGTDRGTDGADVALLDPADAEDLRRRWSDTQARFVDDPREAVQTADGLVAELMQTLARSFSEHKGELETQWRSGGDPDTEELRQALRRYRSFFDRLLSA